MTVTEKDRDVLARTLWGGARGGRAGWDGGRGLVDPQPGRRWEG